MAQQVITIHPNGTLTGLEFKRGKGVSLKDIGGKAFIKRVSLVEWDADEQKWYIKFLEGPYRDQWVTSRHLSLADLRADIGDEEGVVLYFDDYDDAVSTEVEIIQAMMLKGEWAVS